MYIIALTAVLAMSLACLGATDAGYFVFEQKVEVPTEQDSAEFLSDIMVDYEVGGAAAVRMVFDEASERN